MCHFGLAAISRTSCGEATGGGAVCVCVWQKEREKKERER